MVWHESTMSIDTNMSISSLILVGNFFIFLYGRRTCDDLFAYVEFIRSTIVVLQFKQDYILVRG